MTEINVGGVFVSVAVVTAGMAGLFLLAIKRLFLASNLYRFFWNRYLVDLAVFAMLWAIVAIASSLILTTWSVL